MSPEPLPWDRRDFRRPERSGPDLRFGGGGGPHRWREQHHSHAPPPYHHHQQQRWYSPRLLPPGYGKQGGWRMYSDDAGQGFVPLGSRYADRNSEDENCRPLVSRGDGRYFRNNRENRGSFVQKDWKAPSLEPATSPSAPGKPITVVNNLRSIENTQPCHNRSSRSSYASHPLPNSVNLSDPSQSQCQSLVKEKNNESGGTADEMTGSGQESEKENCLGSVDWKPLKWSRLGSLSSRGSCFSHSSSSKSLGVGSSEIVAEVQLKNATLIESPSADAACVKSSSPAESDGTGARKKRRLGWGEGLAKYEKKKVEGPEDGAPKNELMLSVITAETLQSQPCNLPERSPGVASLSDCASPATSSSVACSSSLGAGEKDIVKEANVGQDRTNVNCSPAIVSQTDSGGPTFNLENLELASIANLSSLINELLQSNDPTSEETGYVRTTSMNKLLVWKDYIFKALEMTESEIESLETELKSLIVEPRICCPAGSSLLPGEEQLKPCEGLVTASKCAIELDPLQINSSGEMIVENAPVGLEDVHVLSKDEYIDSPGSATSKFVEVLPAVFSSGTVEFVEGSISNSSNLDEKCLKNDLSYEENSSCVDNHLLIGTTTSEDLAGVSSMHCDVENIYDTLFSSNREAASRAMEQLNKLLPEQHLFDSSIESTVSSLQRDPSVVKEKFLMRKRFLRFKEKVLTLKFKVFQYFCKEGRLVSIRKLQRKTQKKFDPSRNAHKRNHSSSRSRVSFYAGGPQTVKADEVIEVVNGLLSELAFKPYRNTLKMPALVLDKQVKMSRFISNNGLVEDPCAVEKERSLINPWTAEEKEIFVDKLGAFGKDFGTIASFLDHKTVADCIEFYYKNHKSKFFEKTRKNTGFLKQRKSQSTMYLVASGKRRNPELNAASLDILGAASEIVANADDGMDTQLKSPSRFSFGASSSCKAPKGDDVLLQGSDSTNMYSSERETEAADVLASICGSLSSEAVSSCITSSVDHPGDNYLDGRGLRIGSLAKRPLTPEVTQDVDEECSDESCDELNPTDWSDEEKSIFIRAVSIYGKDFVMISQCVRTRSMDQCKLFFSKARKCLGLDLIQPGDGTASGDGNGGDSDIEDGGTVESGSVICNNGSECKMEEDLPPPDMKLNHESDVVGAPNLGPDFKISKGNNELGPLDSVRAEPVSKDSSMVGSHGDEKTVADFNVQSKGQNATDVAFVSMQELQTMVVSSHTESEQGVEEEDDHGVLNRLNEADNKALVEVSDWHCGKENQQKGPLLPEGIDNKIVEDRDANSSEVSDISSGISETRSEPQHSGNVSHRSVDDHSSTQVDKISEYQKKAGPETFSTDKSCMSSMHQDRQLASMTASTLFPVPIKYQKSPNHHALLAVGANEISDTHSPKFFCTGDSVQHLPGYSLSNSMKSSQILRGYPVSVQTMKEINGDVNCEKLTALPNVPEQDRNLSADRHTDFLLEKCNGSRQQSKVVDAPLSSLEQSRDHSRPQSGCSSAMDKPSRNGDVKLFGKILISSRQKPHNSVEQTDGNSSQVHKLGRESLNLKLNADLKVNFDSAQSKLHYDDYIGTENIPVRSYGMWDGNRIQTGIHPLPDSALLLTKYPAAFSNYTPRNVKLDQPPPLRGTVKTGDCPMNVFPSTELSSRNGQADRQGLRNQELHPFTLDMKQQQDVVFTEMQRRNSFDVVSGMQQPRGMLGISVVGRGGVLVGGQCSSLSDPVMAIKMHYAKAEQLSMQGGNIIKEDDRWMSRRDVGR